MTSATALDTCSNGDQNNRYEELGRKLLQAVMAYSQCLRQERLPTPRLSPSNRETTESLSEEGLREKMKVIELAQELLATTIDPATSLLLDSLQVRSRLATGSFSATLCRRCLSPLCQTLILSKVSFLFMLEGRSRLGNRASNSEG
jgi:hypothetical protein